MKPEDLYEIIRAKYPCKEVAGVCYVNKDCKRLGFCSSTQQTRILDFDEIKNLAYHGSKKSMPSSVDAVCLSGNKQTFCFVELKGWQQYIDYLTKQRYSVEETVDDYNLKGKLTDSQELCMLLASDIDAFAEIPVCFILVTDIDTSTKGLDSFHSMMTDLANCTDDLYSSCVSAARKTLDSEIHINHYYITCKQFDQFLSRI